MHISYKKILKQAWHIAFKNKFLWLFGIFAAFASLENVYEIIMSQASQAQDPETFYVNILNFYNRLIAIINNSLQVLSVNNFDFLGFLMLIVVGAVIILFIWLALTSQIFIIKSANYIYRGQAVSANDTFHESNEHFWPILALNIFIKILLGLGFAILSAPLLYFILVRQFDWLIYFNIAFFILYVIFSVAVSFMAAYATSFIVIKNMTLGRSIAAAWKLFKKNFLFSFVMSTILFVLKLVSIILILSVFLIFLIPSGSLLVMFYVNSDLLGMVLDVIVLALVFTLISAYVNSLFTVFYLSSWTIAFIRLTEDTLYGKVLNWMSGLPDYVRDFAQEHKLKIDERKIRRQAAKISKQAEKQAQALAKELAVKYKEYKPIVKKESKKLYRQAKTAYKKYQPAVKKESLKMSKEIAAAYEKFEPIIEKRAKQMLIEAKKRWQPAKTVRKSSSKKRARK